jgi:hypothetical protein
MNLRPDDVPFVCLTRRQRCMADTSESGSWPEVIFGGLVLAILGTVIIALVHCL